jgi:hypothetical protein
MKGSSLPLRSRDSHPRVLGLFEKRIDGDDSLMELARHRFQETGLGTELHAATPDELAQVMQFLPPAHVPVVVHLARRFRLTEERDQACIVELATRFSGQVYGWVMHDHPDMALCPKRAVAAAGDLDRHFERLGSQPMLFLEYAAGLDFAAFRDFFGSIRELPRISACLDTGHVGIQQARLAYAQTHPGVDICGLKAHPEQLPEVMADVDAAVDRALPAVLDLIRAIHAFGKPTHFHLHDGHPLSRFSPFGVSDHLSFFAEVPLPFAWRQRHCVPGMFGSAGLRRIVEEALRTLPASALSFTLEIHPTLERLDLTGVGSLFHHWRDKTNAERMNHWLWVLSRNQKLLDAAIATSQAEDKPA